MGLLKTAAKVGVASAVHGRVQRRQQNRWAAHDQVAAPPPPPVAAAAPSPAPPSSAMGDRLALLQQLGELRDAGVLTEAEFDAKKANILHH